MPKAFAPRVDPGAVPANASAIPMQPLPPAPPPPPPVDPNRPAPPPGYAPPPGVTLPPTTQYVGSSVCTLSPVVLAWVPAVGLAFIFFATFFPWSGCYPGGITAYTQSFWGALGNGLTADTTAEQVMKAEASLEKALRSDWWLLLPYLLALLVGLGVAWADRLVTAPDFAYRMGPLGTLRAMTWPRRGAILFICTAVCLVMFALESVRGFGLEAAVRNVAAAKYKEEADKVDNTADRQKVRARVGVEEAQFGLRGGYAYWLASVAHLAVFLAAGGRLWLDARGETAPAPRLVAEW